MARRKGKAHRTPSRARYEASHPVISVRVSRALYLELKRLQGLSGKSVGDILREAVGRQKPQIEGARRLGFDEAKRLYCVVYSCAVCGQPIEMTSEQAKSAAGKYIEAKGWRHGSCPERNRSVK
jgi:hypothetical protein